MGNIGLSELLWIILVILLLFGVKKLPELGRALGKFVREFRRSCQGLDGEEVDETSKKEKEDV